MRVIHKFQLKPDREYSNEETCIVRMDKDGIVRRVGLQYGHFYLWAEVDPNATKVDRVFHIYGTGWPIPIGSEYVGTFTQDDKGTQYVWHVYEYKL